MTRVYVRKFDWDEARRRYAAGESITAIAHSLGVSWSGVQRVVVPGRYERMLETKARWLSEHRAPCVNGCGNTVTYHGARYHNGRCRQCVAKAQATTARDSELQCVTCREWKPDDAFPFNRQEKYGRRGRHTQCRPCNTAARRDHRARNRDADNAYHRDYKRKLRAKEAA